MSRADLQYLVTGFTQNTGIRVFAFEGIAAGYVRTPYSVQADLSLARKHGIRMQELPLLCRAVLERHIDDDDQRAFTFTEGDMDVHRDAVHADAEVRKKKPSRKSSRSQPE